MKKTFLCILLGLGLGLGTGNARQSTVKALYRDKTQPVDVRVNDLLSRMTLPEMVGQLNLMPYYASTDSVIRVRIRQCAIGSLLKANGVKTNRSLQQEAVKASRFGIPLMFHEDVIHGYRTITPIPLAEACSWDTALVRRTAEVAAHEASAAGIQLTYAPMVDISTDPRWGRILETSGEDPVLSSAMAAARVRGFQGNDLQRPTTIMSCVKHYAGYASLQAGRDYLYTDFSLRNLMETYLPPYRAAIGEGVGSVMCSYTAFNGIPATHSHFLNTEVLRQQLGFRGLLMTDWATLQHAVEEGAAPDMKTSAQRGIESGIDMDMSSGGYARYLTALVREGKVDSAAVSKAAARALEMKFRMGLFDDPYLYFNEKRERQELLSEANRHDALLISKESMVLLKNNQDLLPLSKDTRIVLAGPFAEEQASAMGSWSAKGQPDEVVTVAEGLKHYFTAEKVNMAGSKLKKVEQADIDRAVSAVAGSDVAVVCLGESRGLSGEGVSTAGISLPKDQIDLLKAVRQKCNKVVVVLFAGRPLCTGEVLANCDALLYAWYPGTMAGDAVASLLSGESNPSGKLCQTFPRTAGQIPICYNLHRTFGTIRHADIPAGPQFCFGYGLSYSHYKYSNLHLSSPTFQPGKPLEVTVDIENQSDREGREIAQLYISHRVLTVIPRVKELKAFQSLTIAPHAKTTVTFTLPEESFRTWDADMKWRVENGPCTIQVGTNSEDVLKQDLTVAGF